MKIKEITSQNRNDFKAITECEHCGNEGEIKYGYDDNYYHTKVIPSFFCSKCHRNRKGVVEVLDGSKQVPDGVTEVPEGAR